MTIYWQGQCVFFGFPQNQTLTQNFISWVGFPGGSLGRESACNAGTPGTIPGLERSLEKGIAIHSSILAWRIPWTEGPGELWFMGSQKVRHDWVTNWVTNTTQEEETPARNWKGRQEEKAAGERCINTQITTGQLGLNPWRKLTHTLEFLHLRGMGASHPSSCQFGVKSHGGGEGRFSFSGTSSVLHEWVKWVSGPKNTLRQRMQASGNWSECVRCQNFKWEDATQQGNIWCTVPGSPTSVVQFWVLTPCLIDWISLELMTGRRKMCSWQCVVPVKS